MTGLRRTLRDRRGFTLVELVVVLVILGITASFAVPALTGYIDSAKEKQAVLHVLVHVILLRCGISLSIKSENKKPTKPCRFYRLPPPHRTQTRC